MIYGLCQSAAGLMTQEHRQGVLANNLANAETAGFKRDVATLSERQTASLAGIRRGSTNDMLESLTGGLWLGRTATDFSAGSLQHTGEPTDVALHGPGFFRVSAGDKTLLTRDGRFIMDGDGNLLSATDGAAVLNTAGMPIRLNPRGEVISIDSEGRISQGGLEVGQLGIVDVADVGGLRKVGASRFDPGDIPLTESFSRVQNRVFETSGSQPIRELTSMLEATRAYQLNAQMITLQDQSAARLIGSVNG